MPQGWEAGGHLWGNVATLPLVPAVVDAVHPVPVLAAGGIADGRGLAAARATYINTRLISRWGPRPPASSVCRLDARYACAPHSGRNPVVARTAAPSAQRPISVLTTRWAVPVLAYSTERPLPEIRRYQNQRPSCSCDSSTKQSDPSLRDPGREVGDLQVPAGRHRTRHARESPRLPAAQYPATSMRRAA